MKHPKYCIIILNCLCQSKWSQETGSVQNLKTKIQGLESPLIVLGLRIGHFVNWFCSCLTKAKAVWNSLKLPLEQLNVTFYWFITPSLQPLIISPWISWYMALKVLEFISSWHVRTLNNKTCGLLGIHLKFSLNPYLYPYQSTAFFCLNCNIL